MGACSSFPTTARRLQSLSALMLQGYAEQSCDQAKQPPRSYRLIRDYYYLDEVIGKGSFGTVRRACRKAYTSKKFAIKKISKLRLQGHPEMLNNEIEALLSLDHPNIVKFHEIYQDNFHYYLVLEHCGGEELIERVVRHSRLTEEETRVIMRQIFCAVKYMHVKKVCHRDLKPENFMFSSRDEDAEIKIIDFGMAQRFNDSNGKRVVMRMVGGTARYVAPEVLKGNYDERCDCWSLGVLMYFLLCGSSPFNAEDDTTILANVRKGVYGFEKPVWESISDSAKDLIKKLLVKNPAKRLTAKEAIDHIWFKPLVRSDEKKTSNSYVVDVVKNLAEQSPFTREVARVVSIFVGDSENEKARQAFRVLDVDNKGIIEIDETSGGLNISPQKKKVIAYSEFLIGALNQRVYLDEDLLQAVFKYFADAGDRISLDSLRDVMYRAGRLIPVDQLKRMLEEIDELGHEGIVHERFMKWIKKEVNSPVETQASTFAQRRRASAQIDLRISLTLNNEQHDR